MPTTTPARPPRAADTHGTDDAADTGATGTTDRPASTGSTAGTAAAPADECGAAGRLMDAGDAARLADLFKALADPTRVRLLALVAAAPGGTACACHLTDELGISQPTLSHHLRRLVDAGLVTREQRGRWAHYTAVPETLALARAYLGGSAR